MESYPVDIDPEQVVRWVMEELRANPGKFTITALRDTEVRPIPARRELHLGDLEQEELTETFTVATLDIAPEHVHEGWRLSVVVEDEAGPHVPDDEDTVEPEEEMDLATFYEEFIRPGRGTATVFAEVDGPAAKARVTRLIHQIETDRHHLRSYEPKP